MGHKETIYQGILNGNMKAVEDATKTALSESVSAGELLSEAMIPAMAEVGRLFEANEYYVPEMLIAARAMKAGLALLRPELVKEEVEPLGKVVLGTVKGDLHDIGKNLVGIMIEGAGFEVVDLGVDVSPDAFVSAAKEQNADVIGLSALLTTTMPSMKSTIEAVKEAGLDGKVKVIIGGAPVTQKYADEIGADGYARDAAAAATLVKQLLGK
ncbi:MAG TPA: cobalamin-binding protein [Chloroflexi bacterium]|jgi:5-methyltetrahydrofolate--homocysteine methyltransferase|nr:cobalamin-binding protein [Chloroflexota bacterium]